MPSDMQDCSPESSAVAGLEPTDALVVGVVMIEEREILALESSITMAKIFVNFRASRLRDARWVADCSTRWEVGWWDVSRFVRGAELRAQRGWRGGR